MTDLQAHAQAWLALLDADNAPPALVVCDGAVAKGVLPPYVLVYLSLETPAGWLAPDEVGLESTSDVAVSRAYCHSVGADAAAARSVAARVRTRLLGVTATIAGRLCYPITQVEGLPPTRDETTGPLVMDQVDVYELRTLPA